MIEIAIFIVLIILSGFFSGSETAFFSLTHGQIRMMQQKKRRNAELVRKLKADPQRLLITILIGNNIVNLFTASYATVVATGYFESAALGIATGLTTLLILVFGEIIPKTVAFSHNANISLVTAVPLYALSYILYPLAWVLLGINNMANKIFKVSRASEAKGVTEDEIRVMARLGVESGAIKYRERELIENVFSFNNIEAGDIMTPLYKVVFLNGMVPVDQIAYFVSQEGYSRYPVYGNNNTDDIIGYIHINQLMRALNSDERDKLVKEFASPVITIDESMKIERIFRSMNRGKAHLYMVHRKENTNDIIGLVTLEDVLEEIVGEIHDETDDVGRGGKLDLD